MKQSSSRTIKSPLNDSSLTLIKRLWQEEISPYVKFLLLALLFMALGAATTALLAKLMEPVIDDIFKNEDATKLQHVVIWVFGAFFVRGIANYGESVTMNYIGQSIITNLQKKLLHHLMRADVPYFYHMKTGTLLSRCTHNIQLLKNTLSHAILSLGKDTFTVIALVGVMFYQDTLLATIAFIVFPLSIYPIARLGRRLRRVSATTQKENGVLTAFFTQLFQGMRLIKSYGMEAYEKNRGNSIIDKILELSIKAGKMRSLSSPIMETLGGVAIVIVIGYGGMQVIEGVRSAGSFFSFITALLLAYDPMKRLANLHTNMQEGLSAATQTYEILDQPSTIQDAPNAKKIPIENVSLQFSNVYFSYESNKEVLSDINFHIPTGKTVAFVGPSGAGKSTLFNLILRFFDHQKGSITINDKPLTAYTLASLRQGVGLVTQDVMLFDDTVYNNIAYGNLHAPKEAIIQAAKDAAAHDFITALPQGYETFVGESGIKLSGGQRQRIALARAFLKNAALLLLDEATAALDTKSELVIQKALDKLTKNRTCIVIAHRLSTVKHADHIYVMEHGKIVEEGTHKDLIKQNGLYAYLCKVQLQS